MNEKRRKALCQIIESLDNLKGQIETLKEEEEEAFDSLSEKIQQSGKGEKLENTIGSLDDALGNIDDAMSNIDDAIE